MEQKNESTRKEEATNPVYYDGWEESERGWGERPDGCSLHLTLEDHSDFIKEYWAGMPSYTPDEYSRPAETPIQVYVTKDIFNRVKKAKNGIRLWQGELGDLRSKNKINYCGRSSGWMPVKPGKLEDSLN